MKVSIRIAFLTVLILSNLFVSILIMFTINDKFNDKLMTFVINDIENVVENCTQEITNSVLRIQEANDILEVSEDFVKLLKFKGDDDIENASAVSEVRENISDIKTSLGGGLYGYSCSFFVDSSMPMAELLEGYGNKKFVSDSVNLYNTGGLEDALWYKELLAGGQDMCIFEDDDIPQYVFLAQTIKDKTGATGEILGISLVGIDFQNILRDYGNIENKEFLEIIIVNNAAEVICTNDESIKAEVMEFAAQYRNSNDLQSDSMTRVSIGGIEYYACMYELDFGMTLVAAIPHKEVFITINETTREVYGIVIIILLVVLMVTILLSGVIVRPIKRLSDFMEQTGGESPADSMKDSRIREIDTLYKSFDSMTKRIRKLLITAQNLGEQKKETEFKMLQAQINPHYLYNALDSIAWTALRRGEEDIADLASALADSFRYNAKSSEMIIDFQREIEFITNYVKLQEKCRKGVFDLDIDVAEELMSRKIPKFMIQPLVENSIVHGLKRGSDRLRIKISAVLYDDLLEIHTEDDGVGFDTEALNRYLNGDYTVFDTEKIGIINIHKRLKNKYGERAGLRYAANEHGGLTAIIALPLNEGEKNSEIF